MNAIRAMVFGMKRHPEPHSTSSEFVRDVIIGMADGLTVPFAIAAGLASAGAATHTVVIAAVVSEIAAGSISMGLGGYLAARTDAEHYAAERAREEREVEDVPEEEEREVVQALAGYGLSTAEGEAVAHSLKNRKTDWVNFMMRYELGLEAPDPTREFKSAGTIASAYIVGGIIPLAPYLFITTNVILAVWVSVAVTLLALMVFGYLRGVVVGIKPWKSALQTTLVGGSAAAAAFLLAKLAS
ncbi:MAG: VIT1/CCC1 transporter family protein [Minisyncoccia bacterium]